MPVIAMTQEMGSLAKDVALQLAETMNLQVMQHEVVDHVAQKTGLTKSAIRRVREGKSGFIEHMRIDDSSIAVYTAEEVFAVADKGDVVLRGWGSTCLLRPVSHVVCVRVTRSLAKRVEWVANHLDTDDMEFAESEVRRSDHAHATRMHQQFGVTWGDPLLYDIVLNTDRISVDGCVDQIRSLANRPEFQETAESRQKMHNMTLEAHIRAALRDHAETDHTRIEIACESGRVHLHGIVLNGDERNAVQGVIQAVPGVVDIDNQLRLMAGSRLFTSAKY